MTGNPNPEPNDSNPRKTPSNNFDQYRDEFDLFDAIDGFDDLLDASFTAPLQAKTTPEPTPEELALKAKIDEYTGHFQIISAVVGARTHFKTPKPTEFEKATELLSDMVCLSRWNSRRYVQNREDIVRALKPYSKVFGELLNRAVITHLLVRNDPFARHELFGGSDPQLFPISVPDRAIELVLAWQKSNEAKVHNILKGVLEPLVRDVLETREAYKNIPQLYKDVILQWSECLELALSALAEPEPSIIAQLEAGFSKLSTQFLQRSKTDQSGDYSTDNVELQYFRPQFHDDMIPLYNTLERVRSQFASSLTPEAHGLLEIIHKCDELSWFICQGKSERLSPEDFDESATFRRIKNFAQTGQEAPEQLNSIEVNEDILLDLIYDAAYAFAMWRKNESLPASLPHKFRSWLEEGETATEHVQFLLQKAFEDPSFLEQFPLIMGSGLIRVPKESLVKDEDFPSEWVEPIPTRCGTITPEFVYRDYKWGLSISTYLEPVAD